MRECVREFGRAVVVEDGVAGDWGLGAALAVAVKLLDVVAVVVVAVTRILLGAGAVVVVVLISVCLPPKSLRDRRWVR